MPDRVPRLLIAAGAQVPVEAAWHRIALLPKLDEKYGGAPDHDGDHRYRHRLQKRARDEPSGLRLSAGGGLADRPKRREAVVGEDPAVAAVGDCRGATDSTGAKPCSHDTLRIAWAKLLARVGEEFPRACSNCRGDVRLISFITRPESNRKILVRVGAPLRPPTVLPAQRPPVDFGDLVQSHGDGTYPQEPPGDRPVIDIHDR